MKKLRNVIIVFFFFTLSLAIAFGLYWRHNISAVDKNDDKNIEVNIAAKSTSREIAKLLKDKDLIHNEKFFYTYLRLMNINDIKASNYILNKTMNLEEIVETLRTGNSYNKDEIKITFREGLNIRQIAKIIANKTKNTEEDVYAKLEDEKYIDNLIEQYWFLTDVIKNEEIYYSLEGYLFPDTYIFKNKDVSVETIFNAMLKQSSLKLKEFEKDFTQEGKSVHDVLSLASIVELEGVAYEDRRLIAGVFMHRLKINMPLGSDVTTYYGAKVNMADRDLYKTEIHAANKYNTRHSSLNGKLPIGPVSNPSLEAIKATVNYEETDFLYFVADKYRKVYFTKTYAEHEAKIAEIKSKGDWIEW